VVAIVMYHAVIREPLGLQDWCFLPEREFREQLLAMRRLCDVIPLSTVISRLQDGSVHRPTVAITFDDGFRNNYDVAFPILRETGTPATVFLATGFIDSVDTLWFCRLVQALARTSRPSLSWREREFMLTDGAARAAASRKIQAAVKSLPPPDLLAEVRTVIEQLGQDPDEPVAHDSPFRMLDRAAIGEMAASGLVEFGAHTASHAILSRLTPAAQRDEIERSLTAVRDLTGRSCELFAYPNGLRDDYTADTIRLLSSAGVTTCVTSVPGVNDSETPRLELRRHGFGADSPAQDLEGVFQDIGVIPERAAGVPFSPATGRGA
jgi:peptidoglycan/xylan/chitin deacetylase (PgdA/CDA1 family)